MQSISVFARRDTKKRTIFASRSNFIALSD